MSEEKPKEGVKTENDHINLKVAGQDGSVVQFKIKRHTPLSKLMKAYCERQLEMEDEDTIDVFQQQTGGARATSRLLGVASRGTVPVPGARPRIADE
ncbi:small ubiquitin-related modifier 3 isoform X2 [Eulemur rufifrons]|uniref:small ubiquitin-related modifier 3 isoform X2 n=1 Tax=Eulemur rufifrons TaxID=859984 RepID=UPI0037425FC1